MTPEERALAERLARLSPHGEPSPALDARILAAAHAAATTPMQRQHPTRRWPLALGIAASLTLAVGIAWQLRPLQEATTYDETASATAVQAEVGAAADSAAAIVERAPSDVAAPSRAPVSEPSREATNVRPAPRPAAPATRVRAPAPAAPPQEEPAVVFDAPSEPAAVATQPPPAPPAAAPVRAPVAPAPAAKAASADSQARAVERNSAAAGVAATSRESAFAEDAADEDVPPATADSPEVREAWLQRIRELATAGDTGDARASLREFVHRYPNHPVPDDLRNLLE